MLIGAVSVGSVHFSERSQRSIPESEPPALPPGVGDVLAVLRSSGIVVDSADQVVKASPAAVVYGLVRDSELAHAELRHLARQVRRDGVIREAELDLARSPHGSPPSAVRTCCSWSTTAPTPAGSRRCAGTSSPTSATS